MLVRLLRSNITGVTSSAWPASWQSMRRLSLSSAVLRSADEYRVGSRKRDFVQQGGKMPIRGEGGEQPSQESPMYEYEDYDDVPKKGKGLKAKRSQASNSPPRVQAALQKKKSRVQKIVATPAVKKKSKEEKTVQPSLLIPLPPIITVTDLSKSLAVRMAELQYIMSIAGHEDVRADKLLTYSEAELLAFELNIEVKPTSTSSPDFDLFPRPPPADIQSLPLRPPVVAIMGHVDHGKTTLLDTLRSASVAAGEAGGITQHVGAFSVNVKGMSVGNERKITFLDTPGHAAFSQMRSRGAKVTDIVVLVVAADDGVMPQTREVLQTVKEVQEEDAGNGSPGGLNLLIAISKMDRVDANAEKVKQQLLAEGVELEEYGGEVSCVEISGKTGAGLDVLQDTLVAISELNELRAESEGPAEGYVIESRVNRGLGNTAIVLVKRGTLRVGDCCVAGLRWCKVRRLMDSSGSLDVELAMPGEAVLTTGWRELPMAGDRVLGLEESADAEGIAKKCVETRKRIIQSRKSMLDVDAINDGRRDNSEMRLRAYARKKEERKRKYEVRMRNGKWDPSMMDDYDAKHGAVVEATGDVEAKAKEVLLIVKGDVSGTVEAVMGAISDIGNAEVCVKVIHSGVGEVSGGDLDLAQALGGQILAFNVPVPRAIQNEAQQASVKIFSDNVIYRLMTYVKDECSALLPPVQEIRVEGEAVIQQIFMLNNVDGKKKRIVAGCRVLNGAIHRRRHVRVLRDGAKAAARAPKKSGAVSRGKGDDALDGQVDSAGRAVIYEGNLASLLNVRKEMEEIRKGNECGLYFEGNFEGFAVGDVVQSYRTEDVRRTL